MIQDIIQYADEEYEEGIIVFLDQQKAFDRVEWGWVDFVEQTIPLTKEEKEERQTTDNTIDNRRERRKTDNRQYH